MDKLLITLLIAIASFPATRPAHAASFPPVFANGLEWLQPLDFIDSTWADVGAVCNSSTGECNGTLAGFDVTGWTWASVDDLNALFSTYLNEPFGPGPDSRSLNMANPDEEQATISFFADFEFTDTGCFGFSVCVYNVEGWTRTATGLAGYIGSWTRTNMVFTGESSGMVSTDSSSPSGFTQGAWLYRADVPAPATLGLCLGGLVALVFSRRKRQI